MSRMQINRVVTTTPTALPNEFFKTTAAATAIRG